MSFKSFVIFPSAHGYFHGSTPQASPNLLDVLTKMISNNNHLIQDLSLQDNIKEAAIYFILVNFHHEKIISFLDIRFFRYFFGFLSNRVAFVL